MEAEDEDLLLRCEDEGGGEGEGEVPWPVSGSAVQHVQSAL